jgi:hypothetical protein
MLDVVSTVCLNVVGMTYHKRTYKNDSKIGTLEDRK